MDDRVSRWEHIITEHDAGRSYADLAKELGITAGRVAELYKHGLEARKRRSATEARATATRSSALDSIGLNRCVLESLLELGFSNLGDVIVADRTWLTQQVLRYPNVGRTKLNQLLEVIERVA